MTSLVTSYIADVMLHQRNAYINKEMFLVVTCKKGKPITGQLQTRQMRPYERFIVFFLITDFNFLK